MSLMGVREYARHRGVSHTAVGKAIKAGRIKRRKDGKIDSNRADAAWAENTDLSKPLNSVTGDPKHKREGKFEAANPAVAGVGDKVPPSPPVNGSGNGAAESSGYAVHRALREEFAAKTAELEFRQRLGELVEVDQIRRDAYKAGRISRDLVLSLPPRLAPILAAIADEGEAHAVLEAAVREICEEIARLSVLESAGHAEPELES